MATEFDNSYAIFESYPRNLTYKTSYSGVLKAYGSRLETAEPPFLTRDPDKVEIHFRDWDNQERRFSDHEITSEDTLKTHLGDLTLVDPSTGKTIGNPATKKDPRCRFIFLHAELSTKPLKITSHILKRLFTFHQVMPSIIDFLSVFGHPPQTRELGYSGFYDQTRLSSRSPGTNSNPNIFAQQLNPNQQQPSYFPIGPAVNSLGRSGRQFQLCYSLKKVARMKGTARDDVSKQKWSIQQNVFHHQFDVQEGTMLCINAKGRLNDYRDQVLELTGGANGQPEDLSFTTREECFRSSLTVHLMNCNWATDDWRGYVDYLEEVVETYTRQIVVGQWKIDDTTYESLQTWQRYAERMSNASVSIEANIEVTTSLRTFYAELATNRKIDMGVQCAEAIDAFVRQTNDMIHSFQWQKRRAKFLFDTMENRKILLLQKIQGRATKRMEDLTTLTYRDTIGMKIITVGTFVFLPATFVSTFFSTDIIKYQNAEDSNGSFSGIALERWAEVTIPLTALTFAIGMIAFYLADKRRKKMNTGYDESEEIA